VGAEKKTMGSLKWTKRMEKEREEEEESEEEESEKKKRRRYRAYKLCRASLSTTAP
jgi:hypothetical protein